MYAMVPTQPTNACAVVVKFMSQPKRNHCDLDITGDVDTRKSTDGCIYNRARGAISWCSQLQQIVPFSTTKDEYIS